MAPRDSRLRDTSVTRRTALLDGVRAIAAATVATSIVAHPTRAAAQDARDVSPYNALLAAEYGAIAAYTAGAGILSSPPSGDPLASAAPTVLAVAGHFLAQHQAEAAQLVATITEAGGTPVDQATIHFDIPADFSASVLNVIRLAANAERAATIAYANSVSVIADPDDARLLVSISGVHAQHFAVLSLLADGIIAATGNTMAQANDVVPAAFILSPAMGVPGLGSIPDFTYD